METARLAINIDKRTLSALDRLVKLQVFTNRSRAIQEAVEEKLDRLGRTRLAEECAKADVAEEQAMAEKGLTGDSFPAY